MPLGQPSLSTRGMPLLCVRDNHLRILFKKCKAYGFAQATSAASDYDHAFRKADIHEASTAKVYLRNNNKSSLLHLKFTAPSD
jgi:hypothetical protein